MSEDSDKIVGFLKARADTVWAESGQPYLLSFAAPEMAAEGIDYKQILDGERLKAFVLRTQGDGGGYRIIQHPTQTAKLAIVPHGVEFQFDVVSHGEAAEADDGPAPLRGRTGSHLLTFLHALSELPPEDLDGVIIPTRVLVKLARKK